MPEATKAPEATAEPQKKGFRDINIYSRKFLLSVAVCMMIAYGMYDGKIPWKDGANYIAWVVSIYCLSEGVADHGGKGSGQIEKILQVALGVGATIAPKPPEAPLAVPDPKAPKPKPPVG